MAAQNLAVNTEFSNLYFRISRQMAPVPGCLHELDGNSPRCKCVSSRRAMAEDELHELFKEMDAARIAFIEASAAVGRSVRRIERAGRQDHQAAQALLAANAALDATRLRYLQAVGAFNAHFKRTGPPGERGKE
jgi:hypothetical protein